MQHSRSPRSGVVRRTPSADHLRDEGLCCQRRRNGARPRALGHYGLRNGLGRYQEAFAAASEALRRDPAELWFSPGLEPDRPGNGDETGVGNLGRGHVSQWDRLAGECVTTLDLETKAIVDKPACQPFADGQPQEETMQSPIEVVRRFSAAWSENRAAHELAEFFTDDAVYHNIPLKPVAGIDDIENTIATFIRPGRPGIESIDFRVINIAANGPVVMTERVDVFTLPGRSSDL